jgi:hypothetical protein
MKKVTILGIVLILLAVSVVPVLAKDPPHGNGNSNNAGQGNSTGVNPGDTDQVGQQKQDRQTNNSGNGNANHGEARARTPFYLQGIISAVDSGAKTITVTLIHGNAKVKGFIGSDLVIKTTDATLIYQVTQGDDGESATGETTEPVLSTSEDGTGRVPKTFADLAIGQKVAIHGRLVVSDYTARLITFYVQMTVTESSGG